MVLVSSISNFFISKTACKSIWMSFSSSNLALYKLAGQFHPAILFGHAPLFVTLEYVLIKNSFCVKNIKLLL